MSDNAYHDHLDVCLQCREHPFNLCPIGAQKLNEAYNACAASSFKPLCATCGGTRQVEEDAAGALGYVVKKTCPDCVKEKDHGV